MKKLKQDKNKSFFLTQIALGYQSRHFVQILTLNLKDRYLSIIYIYQFSA